MTTWLDLERSMLSEMSGRERQILHDHNSMWNVKMVKVRETGRRRVVVRGSGVTEMEEMFVKGYKLSVKR